MLNWLASLFEGKKKQKRRGRKHLTVSEKMKILTDRNINEMEVSAICDKYTVSKTTVYKIIRNQRELYERG